jgi:shikimate kinase
MDNLFLIGYRCTGKTSVGKSLAMALGWPFIDADSELVKTCGSSISEIVKRHGWKAFREMEGSVIKRICGFERYVVATGGGAVLDKDNVKQMKRRGVLVWLRARPEIIEKRMLKDEHTQDLRPPLTSKGLIEEIEETLTIRKPYYEEAMSFFVDTDDAGVNEVCDIILKKLNDMGMFDPIGIEKKNDR